MKVHAITATALAAVCLAGCRTTKDVLDDYERNAVAGAYDNLPGESAELAAKGDDSCLFWHLMAGGGYYMSGAREQANAHFDAAEDMMQKNDAKSVFEQGASGGLAMMTNDRAFPYDGGGQDRVFTCLYKAIDFMSLGKASAARTELNRALQHQENWIWERRKDVEAAERRMSADAAAYAAKQEAAPEGDHAQLTATVMGNPAFAEQVRTQCGFDPAKSGNLATLAAADYLNAYAQHVCGVFRWLNGDGGRGALKTAAELAPQTAAARDLAECERGVKPSNQVWIWVEDGLCPAREEWRIDLPLILLPYANRYVMYAGMAFPRLRPRGAGATRWSVQAGGAAVPFAEETDVDHLIRTEFDVYMRGALAREITRTIVKVGTQVALGVAADNTKDWRHEAGLRAAQIGVATWALTTTAADLRSWTALPKTVKCVRVTRPADGRIVLQADGQQVPLAVPPGNTMVFVRKPGPAATPVVKMVAFAR